MAGVDIKYKGSSIASIQGSGSKTLKTQGKYCEGDILVDYAKEGITPSGTKNISTNGTHDVTDYVSANVSVSPNVGSKNVSANGTYNASSDSLDGYSSVTVNVPQPSGSINISENGTYDVTDKSSAVVNIPAFTVTNLVPSSLEADGTPYNNGLGYKTGYTLSVSVGNPSTETARSNRAITGFIPASRYDIIRVINIGVTDAYPMGIWIFDSDKNLLNALQMATVTGSSFAFGNIVGVKLDGRSPENSNKVAYIRVVCAATSAANLIVTKNQKISPLEE